MADDDDDGVLPAYIEEDAAAAKQQRRQQSKKPKEKMPWDCTTPEEIAAWDLRRALSSKLYEYDPKTGLSSFARAWFYDLTKFDLEEETQYGPMRFTDSVIRDDHILSDSLNILYLKIMSSDVGYPINLYGTVIVRDNLDDKCINIFRRDRFNCQLIQSEKECLILTGPSRGIVFHGDAFVEIDLKIKEDEGCNDREFSKGLIALHLASFKSKVESETLVSRLSEVELAYAYVKNALEGTIEIKVLVGPEVFHGRVTAYTTDVPRPIMSSDVGYPINLYGTVIVRDNLDDKCINIFRRDKFNCQLIQSENEDLILTGPTRGIVFHGDALFEIDLKIKEDEEYNGRQFSKGLIVVLLAILRSKVESETLVSRLSEVQLAYAYVKNALEGTIEIKVLTGPEVFHGKVTACTTDVAHSFLLCDSNVKGGAITVGDDSLIQLLRRVLAVSEDKMLVIDIVAHRPGDHNQSISCACTEFATQIKGSDEEEITCGPYRMRVKVIWSTLSWP